MSKGQRKYNGTQKVEIIKRIHRENLSFKGASREYGISDRTLRDWERIYWEEGEEALLLERRGRACAASGTQKDRKPKLDKQVEEDLIAENQRLRMEIDYLKTPKQKAQVVQELRQKYPLKALLQLAGLPRSTFYYYLHQSQNPAKYQMVKEQIVIIFNENEKRYGYRRITKELHNNDICVNHKTVRKLMKQLGLVCQVRAKRKYSSYKGEVGEVAPNLLERHFKTNQPNRKWVTDVTEFKVNDQKLYLSPILDLFNGEVVSYNLSRHPNFKQITDMLEGAFQKLPDKVDNLILHSDQGWQYQMKSYQNLLKAKGITQSMSRKATCLDNAVAENFFGLLKTELFYLEKFDSIDQLEKAIVDYIDYYNNRRIKLKLNGLSPVQYRIQTVGAA